MQEVEQKCMVITKSVLPAVRASIAQAMKEEYGWTQDRIAKELGVVQVAVSKYLNKKYSDKVAMINKYANSEGIGKKIAKKIIDGMNKTTINRDIDSVCADIILQGY